MEKALSTRRKDSLPCQIIASRSHVSQITVSAAFHVAGVSKLGQCRTTPMQKQGRLHWSRLKEAPSDLVRFVCYS
jgi:hypothetical protein